MDSTEIAPNKPRRGIYLLPNLFTTGGMFAGFYAIIAAINAHYVDAAIAVFVAGLLDGLDGRIARLTNTQSEFGMQYDSLADLVSFGVAPALVMYTWALEDLRGYGPLMGKAGWAAAFLYAACAAVRLARFNTQAGTVDKRFFIGLASPAAAGVMMSFVWAAESLGWPAMSHPLAALCVCVLTAVLMVTRIRYWSFKSWPARERVPFLVLPVILGVFALLAVSPSLMLLSITALYLLSGPTLAIASLLRRRDDAPRPG
jgi:CDP-diacylglycerol---serine O-phosphatidyltransferase